jgi:CheY-like chemotaxis protein
VRVRFEVQDTGEGIAPDRQAGLFSAFEQGDNSTTRRHGGTGLGLSLTKQLALAMDGIVGMHSEPGVGSTFWFEVWLERPHTAGQRAAPVAMTGLRALLVDDLPEALAVITSRLGVMGLQVDSLTSGAAALQKVKAEMALGRPYDVVLLDMRMEGMDGIETLQHLRALLGEGMPPSILVTASADDEVHERARSARFDAVLLKPITASALHESLGKVLRKQGVMLPANSRVGHASEAAVRARHEGQRVLLVEDNEVNREVAEELIANAGLIVELANDGRAAVELALSRAYDLIMMDMQMPVMDGLQAAREIRARAGPGIPIIAMTANAFAEDRLACLEAGMNDHVAKPVDPVMLYSTLLRWLPLRDKAATADT